MARILSGNQQLNIEQIIGRCTLITNSPGGCHHWGIFLLIANIIAADSQGADMKAQLVCDIIPKSFVRNNSQHKNSHKSNRLIFANLLIPPFPMLRPLVDATCSTRHPQNSTQPRVQSEMANHQRELAKSNLSILSASSQVWHIAS